MKEITEELELMLQELEMTRDKVSRLYPLLSGARFGETTGTPLNREARIASLLSYLQDEGLPELIGVLSKTLSDCSLKAV